MTNVQLAPNYDWSFVIQFLLFVFAMHCRHPLLLSSSCTLSMNCCLMRGKSIMLVGSLRSQNASNSLNTATAHVGVGGGEGMDCNRTRLHQTLTE